MPDDIFPDRVTAIATAAQVPLAPIDAERIARAVAPTAAASAARARSRATAVSPRAKALLRCACPSDTVREIGILVVTLHAVFIADQ
jgi:hypothetical protein